MRFRRAGALAMLLSVAGCGFQSTAVDGGDGGDSDDLASGAPVSFDVEPAKTSVNEHEPFSVHVVALDSTGAVARNYAGSPTVLSDWGDAHVVGSAQLTAGEAQLTIALNRETNAAAGLAHLLVSDGQNATGVSAGITVLAPPWTGLTTITFPGGDSGAWDVAVANPAWNISSVGYSLWYTGRSTGVPGAVGLALSPDGASWQRDLANPIFTPLASGFEVNGIILDTVIPDEAAQQFVMIYSGEGAHFADHGVATSPDGRAWTRVGPLAPALDGVCPQILPQIALAVVAQQHYRIWFGTGVGLCTADSTDGGATWSNAVAVDGVNAGGAVLPQAAVRDGSVWRLWYYTSQTEYATSSDGVTWIPSPATQLGNAPLTVGWSDTDQRYEGLGGMGPTLFAATRP